ncbi:hypothetical protein KW790_00545 [Candidatus Parcubacteria bacterium]|nr:hypothetical protein [Candidatus Parcubacteria bacterium]
MSATLLSLVIYIYAVNSAVRNTVARKDLESRIALVSTHLSEMEFKYISLKNKVDLKLALNRGFKEVTTPVFISRSSSRSLSFNTK